MGCSIGVIGKINHKETIVYILTGEFTNRTPNILYEFNAKVGFIRLGKFYLKL